MCLGIYVSEKLNSLDSEFGDGFKATEMSRLRVAVRSNVSKGSIYLFYAGLDPYATILESYYCVHL